VREYQSGTNFSGRWRDLFAVGALAVRPSSTEFEADARRPGRNGSATMPQGKASTSLAGHYKLRGALHLIGD
jgi:hypothetical protein